MHRGQARLPISRGGAAIIVATSTTRPVFATPASGFLGIYDI